MQTASRALCPALAALCACLALAPIRLSASPDGPRASPEAVPAALARGLPGGDGRAERALTLAAAKLCANEAGFESPADCALILQTARHHGRSAAEQLRWLRCHSSRVLDGCQGFERPCKGGNCAWSQNLGWSGAEPEGWPENASWSPERWRGLLRLTGALVSGRVYWRPCFADPWTWGGPEVDEESVRKNDLLPLGCHETRNEGYLPRALHPGSVSRATPRGPRASGG